MSKQRVRNMNEELIDKYLNQSLKSDEEQEFLTLLKDEAFGKFLVKYCVEVYGYHSTAAKMLEDDLEKNKQQWIDVEKSSTGKWSLVALVAAAAILAVCVILFLPQSSPGLVSNNSLQIDRKGEKLLSTHFLQGDVITASEGKLKFADDSQMSLNGRIRIQDLGENKVIVLENGGADFKIAKQKSGTFKVLSGHSVVEVVGTAFSVINSDGETRVNVDSGIVKFHNGTQSITLRKGEKAVDVNGVISAELKNYLSDKVSSNKDPSLIFYMDFDGKDPLNKQGLSGTAFLRKGQFVEGMLEGSRALENGMIELAGSNKENFRIPMTINAWVKVKKETFYGPIITNGDSSWRMQLSEDGLNYHGGYGLTERDEYFNGVNKVKTGMWQMVTLVYTDKLAMMFVDGKFEQKKETELMHLNSDAPIQIGGNAEMPERFFEGLIDEVSIYKRALSEEEILLLYRRIIK